MFLERVRKHMPRSQRHIVSISTVHGYKGLESPTVIILDALSRFYPLVHPDSLFNSVLGDTIDSMLEEERRLFYVALTRAVDELYIVTRADEQSPYLSEIEQGSVIERLDWRRYVAPQAGEKRLDIRVGNQEGRGSDPTFRIRDVLKAQGYRWVSTGWKAWADRASGGLLPGALLCGCAMGSASRRHRSAGL